jgi:hypothetical protein
LALNEQTQAGEPTKKTSIAAVLRIIRSMMAARSQLRSQSDSLARQLAHATTDSYQRHGKKRRRNDPRGKEERSTGPPIVVAAIAKQKDAVRRILAGKAAA